MRILIALIAIVTAFVFGYLTNPEVGSTLANFAVKAGDPEINSGSRELVYKSQHGFSFAYPDTLGLEHGRVVLGLQDDIRAIAIVRYVHLAESWCPNSTSVADCPPLLENPGIAFGVVEKSYEQVIAKDLGSATAFLEAVTINDMEGRQFLVESKGEGIVTLLFALAGNKTLIIQYTIDDFSAYPEVAQQKEVLDQSEQKQLIDQVLSTLAIE